MRCSSKTFQLLSVFSLLLYCKSCYGNFMEFRNPTTESSNQMVVDKWIKMEESIVEVFRKIVDGLLSRVMVNGTFPVTPGCDVALFKLVSDAMNVEDWAIRMVDSAGKPSGGQMFQFGEFGDHEMCVDLSLPRSNVTLFTDNSTREVPPFIGRYCTLNIRPHIPNKDQVQSSFEAVAQLKDFHPQTEVVADLKERIGFMYDVPYRFGICIPSLCTGDDVIRVFYSLLNHSTLVDFEINSCELKEELRLNIFQMVFLSGAIAYTFMLIVVTGIDYKYYVGRGPNMIDPQLEMPKTEHSENMKKSLVKIFSMRTNLRAFFSTKMGKDRTLSCVYGLRFLAMTWILLFQSAAMISPFYIRNFNKVFNMYKSFFMQFLMNGHYAIDTFLLLTSVLLSYNITQSKTRNFRVSSLIVKRIWKFLPSALLATGTFVILPILSDSPIWDDFFNPKIENCLSLWWLPVTYGQNFIKPNNTCLPHLWYLSLDMQYFISVAIIFFIIYYKDKTMANFFVLVLVLSSVSSTGILSFVNHLPTTIAGLYPRYEQMIDQAYHFYFLPHIPLCVYAVGLYLGAYLARTKRVKRKTPLILLVCGWTVAIAGGLTCVYISYFWSHGFLPNHVESAVFNGLNRLTWALSISWLIYICAKGQGGVINQILSWPGFVILNHPSYMMYLFHYLVLAHYYTGIQGVSDMSVSILYYYFFSNLVVVFICGTILRFGFESPMMGLGRLFAELVTKRFNQEINITQVSIDDVISDQDDVDVSNTNIGVFKKGNFDNFDKV